MVISAIELGEGPAVVLLHGFPDLACSFRHQLPALAGAGFRAIAPDLPGVGASAHVGGAAPRTLARLAQHVVELLDARSIERAVFVGHDFGAKVAYELALAHPSRVAGVASLGMPHAPAPPVPPTTLYRSALGERFYLLALREDRAEERLARDVDRTVRYFFRSARGLAPGERAPFEVPSLALLDDLESDEATWARPSVLDAATHARIRDAYARTGFAGALTWYRAIDEDWAARRRRGSERIDAPVLLVTAGRSAIVPAEHTAGMESLCPALARVHVEDAGHHVHQEQPDAVNRALVGWLGRVAAARPEVASFGAVGGAS